MTVAGVRHPASGWTPRSVVRRAREVMRDEGLRTLWFKVLGETVYRRVTLVRLPVDPPPPPRETSLDVSFGFVGADDIDALVRMRPEIVRPEVERRIGRGDRCYAARHEGELVSARWIASERAWIEYLDLELELEPDEVYLYETYTVPAYRGLGVSPAAGTRLAHALVAEGRRSILGVFVPENRPAVRVADKTGYVPVGRAGFVRLGPWRRTFTRRTPA